MVSIEMLDAKDAKGIVGYVEFDGERLVVRTPKNPNHVLRPRTNSCNSMVKGEWLYEFYIAATNEIPGEEIRKQYEQMMNDGKSLYDMVATVMKLPAYTDYRFAHKMKTSDWVARMACLFAGLNFGQPSTIRDDLNNIVLNQSRDCIFILLLRTASVRGLLSLGPDDVKIKALWTSAGLAYPSCACLPAEDPTEVKVYEPKSYTPGSYSYTVPQGVTSITFVLGGGGGTGADSDYADAYFKRQGGGGGEAGEIRVYESVPVREGDVILIVVGAGGKTGAVPYSTVGKPRSGAATTVLVNGKTLLASGGKNGVLRIGGGNYEAGGSNSVTGYGGKGGSNTMATGGEGGKIGFAGADWAVGKGADGAIPGGGGGGAGADDAKSAFPGGDGGDGVAVLYFNGYKYKAVIPSSGAVLAGQNAKRYL